MSYVPRVLDTELHMALESTGAVLIEGPKWCGKTKTATQAAASSIYMQDPDQARAYRAMADVQPSLLLEGATPHLIDEWQMAPVLWDAVRHAVDQRGIPGQFILTGSAVPPIAKASHTGTGRIARIRMRPMSLYESGESTGSVSLNALFEQSQSSISQPSALSIKDIAHVLCRGGWPATLNLSEKAALRTSRDYVDAVAQYDVSAVDDVARNPERVRLLLRSLARNTATFATITTLTQDIESHDAKTTEKTISSYLTALRQIFVVEDLPAWAPSLRSKTAIRTSDKRHFVDPSIATAALRTDPKGLLSDFLTFGFLFESLCARDLRVYTQTNDGDVLHYRDKNSLEADLIIRLRDGRWAAVEVKLGQSEIDKAASNLLALNAQIDRQKMNPASFLMVLTGGTHAYQRTDGVWVVPLGCLKP